MLGGGKKNLACLLSSPEFCDCGLSEAGPEGGDSEQLHQIMTHFTPLGHMLLTAAAAS